MSKPDLGDVKPRRVRLVVDLEIVPIDEETEKPDGKYQLSMDEVEEFGRLAAESLSHEWPYPEYTAGSGLYIGCAAATLVSIEDERQLMGDGRFKFENVRDDPTYWHVIDTEEDDKIVLLCSSRQDAEEFAAAANEAEENGEEV